MPVSSLFAEVECTAHCEIISSVTSPFAIDLEEALRNGCNNVWPETDTTSRNWAIDNLSLAKWWPFLSLWVGLRHVDAWRVRLIGRWKSIERCVEGELCTRYIPCAHNGGMLIMCEGSLYEWPVILIAIHARSRCEVLWW